MPARQVWGGPEGSLGSPLSPEILLRGADAIRARGTAGGTAHQRKSLEKPTVTQRQTHGGPLSAHPQGYVQGHRGQVGGGRQPPTSTPQDCGAPQAGSLPSVVTPTSWVVWGAGSCRSLTLRRLILMAWRKSGGRRWGWERCVAMVAVSAFPSATPLAAGWKQRSRRMMQRAPRYTLLR